MKNQILALMMTGERRRPETRCNVSNVFITTGSSTFKAKSTSYSVSTGPVPFGIKHSELQADFCINRGPIVTMYMTFSLTYTTSWRCVRHRNKMPSCSLKVRGCYPLDSLCKVKSGSTYVVCKNS